MKTKQKKRIKNIPVVLTAIISLTLLDIVALYNGIDGVLMSTIVAIIAALAGLAVPTPELLKKYR